MLSALVMYDEQTDSLWSQFLGEAVEGPLKETKLELVPSQLVTWSAWKQEHPDTQVLDPRDGPPPPHWFFRYGAESRLLGGARPPGRLSEEELILGLVGETTQRAYPYRHLRDAPVVNDTFEGRPIVAVLDVDMGNAALYERTVSGTTLTFDQAEDPWRMIDRETGSTWLKATGEALIGELSGAVLPTAPHISSYWYAWSDYYPYGEVYEP